MIGLCQNSQSCQTLLIVSFVPRGVEFCSKWNIKLPWGSDLIQVFTLFMEMSLNLGNKWYAKMFKTYACHVLDVVCFHQDMPTIYVAIFQVPNLYFAVTPFVRNKLASQMFY